MQGKVGFRLFAAQSKLVSAIKNTAVKEAIKKAKDKRMYQRFMVILYHLKGYINKDISQIIDLCQHTAGTYVNKYKENGLSGLALGHSPGTPRMLTDEQKTKLVEIVTTKTPDEVGYPNKKNWNANIIKHWVLDNFGVEYSYTGMIDLIHRLKLSYTRPTYTLAKADPQKTEPFLQENKDRLQLVFLPPYSLKLNMIEGLRRWLKSDVVNNVFFSSVKQIREAVRGFINSVNKGSGAGHKQVMPANVKSLS